MVFCYRSLNEDNDQPVLTRWSMTAPSHRDQKNTHHTLAVEPRGETQTAWK